MRKRSILGTVVIVDDEEIITRPLARSLNRFFRREELPYEAITFQKPAEFLAEYDGHDEDLAVVISDIMMPQMTGLELLKILKSRYPETLLIVLTGYADQDSFNQLRQELELYSYQEKPWNDDQFRRTVKNALDGYRRKKLLNRYVPREIVKEVLKQSDNKILSGEEIEAATIMFLDFRDSTALFHSESMTGQQALQHLNHYFEQLLIVLDNYENGVLDKFMGDGIMAVFGVPRSISKSPAIDAQNAVSAALEMKERVLALNQKYSNAPLQIGVGISTGRVVAGNVGTDERANYTVLGNDVNIASRLEKFAKAQGLQNAILISEQTYNLVSDFVEVDEVESLPKKGERAALRVFEVKGWAGP